MKILVCVKEVPDLDPETELTVDEELLWIREDDSSRFMMNRFDEFAMEEALLIREQFPDTTVDVLTVGPERSNAVVRRALGMGADQGIHIITETKGYLDPFTISSLVATVAADKMYDLVLTGVMGEDTQQGQTGVMIAEQLKFPWATSVICETMAPDCKSVRVEREIEGGFREVLIIKLPCLLTIQTGTNQPRYPALSKVLRAKKAELEIHPASECGLITETQQVKSIRHPQRQRTGQLLEGTALEKAQQLLKLLTEKSFIQ